MTTQITICNTSIHQDTEGRYSINDLHKAGGGETRHNPYEWMRLDQTKDLINEILITGNPVFKNSSINPLVTKRGRFGGTYVCKELVYSYAMWISAAFALKVIRAYDDLVTGKVEQRTSSTTTDERTPLRDAINMLVGKKGIMYPEAYSFIHQRFNVAHIDELPADKLPMAIEYVHHLLIEGEFIGKQETQPLHDKGYNFPAETADPHDRQYGNAWMTPHVILDERNRAPELELLEALQRDGYDVAGVQIRIYAMYGITKQIIEMQKELD